jgi:hypothetical protein
MQYVQQHHDGREDFLQQSVTGNKTWVLHYETANKHQSLEWKHTSLPRSRKFKRRPFVSKVMLTLFWDLSVPILKHYQYHGQMVNSERYCVMLENGLKASIHSKNITMLILIEQQ